MQSKIQLFQYYFQGFLRGFACTLFSISILSNEVIGQNSTPCATDLLLKEFEKIGTIYEQGDNNHPVIKSINAYTKSYGRAAYCGNTIGWICHNVGIEVQGMPTSLMSVARNWEQQGEVVWHQNKGWATTTHEPKCDEIFVMFFRWGSNHVEVALQFHGGLNFIDGAGNTSNSLVRNDLHKKSDLSKIPKKERYKKGVYIKGSPRREGIFAYKERYNEIGLVKILKFKVKIL